MCGFPAITFILPLFLSPAVYPNPKVALALFQRYPFEIQVALNYGTSTMAESFPTPGFPRFP